MEFLAVKIQGAYHAMMSRLLAAGKVDRVVDLGPAVERQRIHLRTQVRGVVRVVWCAEKFRLQ